MGFKRRHTWDIDTRLATLAELVNARVVPPDTLRIRDVVDDSRKAGPGTLFVAVPGMSVDGHDFVNKAIANGAVALVVERRLDVAVPQLVVDSASDALGVLAAYIAGYPARKMRTVGITGTNGKTTTSYILEAIALAAKSRPGIIGTVSYRWGGKEISAPYTTPTPLVLQETLKTMVADQCDLGLLEVSSAALHMDRLVGTEFVVAAYSNLSQDHLDIHDTMAEYADAKARLFRDHLNTDGTAVINIDDPSSERMLTAAAGRRILRVSRHGDSQAEIRVLNYSSTVAGIVAEIATPRGHFEIQCSALIGQYNVDNIALAVGIAEALEIPHTAIVAGLSELQGVPGRVQRVDNDQDIDIFVDYAHTPDALHNVLSALRPLTKGRLIAVFGCGGDRDPSKRFDMGAAVAKGADLAIVTSDNPRHEDPQAILDMIVPAVPDAFFVDVDRRVAISAAIYEAVPGDVVLIAGKGHEDYQIIGDTKEHFDDCAQARIACMAKKSQAFSLASIVACTNGAVLGTGFDKRDTSFGRVIINGRIAAPGDLYVAIVGEHHDGHDFCQQALDAGATGVVVARGRGAAYAGTAAVVIEVEDPRDALGAIGKLHRSRWTGTLIGVTGSAGKTTTKDLIRSAARTRRVHAAIGSNNNETGVPLTLLGLRPYHDFAVVEMGMRGPGEISYLASIALPDIAVVTNAGTAHVGRLGSTNAIAAAKAEIYGSGIALYPADDMRLAAVALQCDRSKSFADVTGGEASDADVQLMSYTPTGAAGARIVVAYGGAQQTIELPLVGQHNAVNACCALLAVIAAGVSFADAAAGIATMRGPAMRSEIRDIAGRNILFDCYNANPASMAAALQTLSDLRGAGPAKAYAVLGDMGELGDVAEECHEEVGRTAARLKIPIFALGSHREQMVRGAKHSHGIAQSLDSMSAAAGMVLDCTDRGDWILLKASRSMRLERVAESMIEEAEG